MRIPVIRGVIDRRILVSYHVNPDVLANLLPKPFRPRIVKGKGITGICLIRLAQIRPRWMPALMGISSENAAHRIAVEWDYGDTTREGVFIPRRDTSSRLNSLAGGRFFPGVHHHGKFDVNEEADRYSVVFNSDDRTTHIAIECRLASGLPSGSVFDSVEEASAFFRHGSLGYSDSCRAGMYDGLELRTLNWSVQPLAVDRLESSYCEDTRLFPTGSIGFDSALLMQNIQHEWHEQPQLRTNSFGVRPQEATARTPESNDLPGFGSVDPHPFPFQTQERFSFSVSGKP
ncbi:hypothetical protein GC176_27920 [bacterium]|nr:hypothetical protein [bacterium]